MAFPPGLNPKTVTIGIASFFDGTLANGRATISAPVNVIHTPSNRPIFSSDMTASFVDGQVSFNLLPTDAPGLNNVSWTYKLKVEITGATTQPDPIYFLLPTAGPDTVDLDGLVTVPSSAGVPISVDVLSKADFGPSLLTELNNSSSATSVALRAAFVPQTGPLSVVEHGMPISVTDYGVKGDGATDDSAAIMALDAAMPGAHIVFPGYSPLFPNGRSYRLTSAVRFRNDPCITVQPGARIYADATMAYVLSYETSRTQNTIADLTQNKFIRIDGVIDGNDLASDGLRVDKMWNCRVAGLRVTNVLARGYVVGLSGLGAEVFTSNVFIRNLTAHAGSVGIYNNNFDNHFNDVVVVDHAIGIDDDKSALWSKTHPWISFGSLIPGSIGFRSLRNSSFSQCYADTFQTSYQINGGSPSYRGCRVLYNSGVYTSALQTSNPPVVFQVAAGASGYNALGTYDASGVTTAAFYSGAGTLYNWQNSRTGTFTSYTELVANTPSFSTIAISGGTNPSKGFVSGSSTLVQFGNNTSGRTLQMLDTGGLTYNGAILNQTANTFTAAISGATTAGTPTLTTNDCRYVRQGGMVRATIHMTGTFDATIAGNLQITGLPSAISSTAGVIAVGNVGYWKLAGLTTRPIVFGAGNTTLLIQKDGSGSSGAIDTTTLRSTAFELWIEVTYETAAIPTT